MQYEDERPSRRRPPSASSPNPTPWAPNGCAAAISAFSLRSRV